MEDRKRQLDDPQLSGLISGEIMVDKELRRNKIGVEIREF